MKTLAVNVSRKKWVVEDAGCRDSVVESDLDANETMRRTAHARKDDEHRPAKATFARGDYGRIVSPDGTEQWWVRSSKGTWIALRHQRVIINEDGSITLLFLA